MGSAIYLGTTIYTLLKRLLIGVMETGKNKHSKEIDVLSCILKVYEHKISLLVFVAAFAIIGVIYALNKEKTYTAEVLLAPEATSMGMSQSISDLAGLIGVSGGSGTNSVDAIYPDIYPEVLSSTDFIVKLFNIQVRPLKGGPSKSYFNHILQDHKIPFYKAPLIWINKLFPTDEETAPKSKKIDPFNLSKKQYSVYNSIRGAVGCQINKTTSVITISVTDVDPYIAAVMADTIQRRLQEYITLYRTSKARIGLDNAKKLNAEAKAVYTKARREYSSFSDANTDVTLPSVQAKLEDLENEMQLKYNNYTATQQQVQQAEDKLQEDTPAFTIIQNSSIPQKASSTPRSIIVLLFIFIGFIFDSLYVLIFKAK